LRHFLKDSFFLLSGNAGTGKTTIAENIAQFSKANLLAPTNAAIKRLREKMSYFDDERFSTIHGAIYGLPDEETGEFKKRGGLSSAKVFIVDECSMIDKVMLNDLVSEALRKEAKLIFLGDDFQLEPVGADPKIFDWEVCQETYSHQYFKKEWKYKMTEVMRNQGSILKSATHLRTAAKTELIAFDDNSYTITDRFSEDLPSDIDNRNEFVVIVSTNKTRMQYNRHIRNRKFEEDAENPICDGEILISVSNQRFVNGEIYTVKKPRVIKEYDLEINTGSKMYPNINNYKMYLVHHEVEGLKGMEAHKTLVIPNLDKPSLYSGQLMSNDEIFRDDSLTKYVRAIGKRIWRPSVNIATYGYSISAHKSQGQEWDNVYIDCDWLSDAWNKSRWLYTALTRAKKKVEIKRSNQFSTIKP